MEIIKGTYKGNCSNKEEDEDLKGKLFITFVI